jgi:SAM-dependent methyltransferase
MAGNKNHWYDGWFYDTIIAPNQDELFEEIKGIIPSKSEIIDVGCGTGRLEFTLASNCKSVLGIDLSKRNIKTANLKLLKYPDVKISFRHGDMSEIMNGGTNHFDFAVLTYVIHEVGQDERIDLLKQIALVADKIVIGDYLVPQPKGIVGFITKAIEFIAGREHYRNYKSYIADGGVQYLADNSGLRIISENKNNTKRNHIAVLAK